MRSAPAFFFLLATLLTSVALTSPASAQDAAVADEEARRLFEAGELAFHDGRYETALSRFRESYDLSHRPELLYNIASCLDRLRRDAEAIEAFEAFLEATPDTPHRQEVEARLAAMRAATRDEGSGATASTTTPVAEPGGNVGEELWWLWTLIGVGAATAIVVPIVVVTTSTTEAPLPGDLPGGVIVALEVRP